jgi:hypothetical protein
MERDEPPKARSQEAHPSPSGRIVSKESEDGAKIQETARNSALFVVAAALTASAKIESAEGIPGMRKLSTEEEILLAVLRGAEAVARDDARPLPFARVVEDQRDLFSFDIDRVALFAHTRKARSEDLAVIIPRQAPGAGRELG